MNDESDLDPTARLKASSQAYVGSCDAAEPRYLGPDSNVEFLLFPLALLHHYILSRSSLFGSSSALLTD